MQQQSGKEPLDRREDERPEQYELSRLPTAHAPQATETPPSTNVEEADHAIEATLPVRRWALPFASVFRHVPVSSARDHLANERVCLAYIRTSAATANIAVAVLQLYRLKHVPPPAGKLSDYDIGVPLGAVLLVLAIIVAITGATRFFVCQSAMVRDRIVGSGLVVVIFTAIEALVSQCSSSWLTVHCR